jgi:hypothetical protein
MSLEDGAAMRFDRAAFEIAHQRVKSAPLELDGADFVQLGIVSTQLEADAREAQKQAQLAIVAQREPAPVQTKAAPAVKAPETLEEFVERYGKKPVTWRGLMKVIKVSDDVFVDAIKELRGRADTFEQANKDLSARILEIEAQRAATSKVGA